MTTKLNWRLSKLPTPDEVRELVKDSILTKEEAREILFSSETEEDRDKKSLESEIKFLRELVDKLSSNKLSRVAEVIKEIQSPWEIWGWYKSYQWWCDTVTVPMRTITAASGSAMTNLDSTSTQALPRFSDIKTF